MKRDTLRAYARVGAMRRIEELRQEMSTIQRAFPELFRGGKSAFGRGGSAAGTDGEVKRARKRFRMSAAQRKAVSERMRKYWAARRKAKG
jgi:hypothetical protein